MAARKRKSGGQRPPRLKRYRMQKRTKPGSLPGTIVPEPTAPLPRIRLTRVFPDGLEEFTVTRPREITAALNKPGWIWCDVDGLGDVNIITELAQIFGLHPLAVEDVVNTHQRAKIEEYSDKLFMVFRFPHLLETGIIESEQISLFLSETFVLTFQPRPGDAFETVRRRLREPGSFPRPGGPDYLAYMLIDVTIDHYFPILEYLAERLEALDDQVPQANPREILAGIHDLRRELLYVRRTLWPHRDALQVLTRNQHKFIQEATRIHLRDCWDHVIALVDLTETYRELCADLRDYCVSAVSNRMNEIMKWLTLVSTIFIPLSFIAGIYGMNFDPDVSPWNMPELRWYLGYPFSLMLMALVAGIMIFSFYRRGWIGQDWPLRSASHEFDRTSGQDAQKSSS